MVSTEIKPGCVRPTGLPSTCVPSLTHGGGKNDDPQHVHAFAGAGRRLHDDVRRRREIQGEVLHVGAVVVLDAVYVDPARGGLVQQLCHGGFGDELGDSLGSILEKRAGQRERRPTKATDTRIRPKVAEMRTGSDKICRWVSLS